MNKLIKEIVPNIRVTNDARDLLLNCCTGRCLILTGNMVMLHLLHIIVYEIVHNSVVLPENAIEMNRWFSSWCTPPPTHTIYGTYMYMYIIITVHYMYMYTFITNMCTNHTCTTHHTHTYTCTPTEFIHLIASEASDISENQQKKVISPEHVVEALNTLGFQEYVADVEAVHKEYKEQASVSQGRCS